MAQPTRGPRPIVSDSITDTAAQSVLDGLDAGFTIDDMAPDNGPKIRGEARFNQEGLDEIVNLSSKGGAIPGQSLVNDPSQPYPWEQPPEFANPKDALDYMTGLIFQPEAMKEIVVREAKLRNMDPTVAVKVFGGEALNSSSYQSDIPREGKGSLNNREASFGPTQLYTGGGLGNTYEKMTGRYLTDDNNPVGITKQIQFALDMAIKGGWHQWSAAKKLNLNKRAGLSNAKQVNNWRDE